MAGDWLPMRVDLKDDPDVLQMAGELGLAPQHVVGCLHAVWSWFNVHTSDGCFRAPGAARERRAPVALLSRECRADVALVSHVGALYAHIDKLAGVENFAVAMANTGWLEVDEEGIRIPRFEAWNSQSAKRRLLNTRRQQENRSRSGRAAVALLSRGGRDKSATREEKRRDIPPNPPAPVGGEPPETAAAGESRAGEFGQLVEFGVSAVAARELADAHPPELIAATLARARREKWGPGLVVEELRAGSPAAALEVARRRGVDASAARRRELAAQERAELLAWFATFAEPLRSACRARCGTPDDDFAAVHWFQFHAFGETGRPESERPQRLGEFLERRKEQSA